MHCPCAQVLQDEESSDEEEGEEEDMCDMVFAEDDETPRQIARQHPSLSL